MDTFLRKWLIIWTESTFLLELKIGLLVPEEVVVCPGEPSRAVQNTCLTDCCAAFDDALNKILVTGCLNYRIVGGCVRHF